MTGLYVDSLAWSEEQAALLRRLADGERVDAEIDWDNVIEEIASVGRSELHSVQSLLEQAMTHILKGWLDPGSRAAGHWRGEVVRFLRNARRRYGRSMARSIDLQDSYRAACQRAAFATYSDPAGHDGAGIPTLRPWTLDDLLTGELETLEGKLPPR
jgi:hypothetical protein